MKTGYLLLIAVVTLMFQTGQVMAEDKVSLIPLSDVLALATAKVPGKIIKAELKHGFYEVKIMTDEGREEKVYIDAIEGKIVEKAGISLDEATKIALKEVSGEVVKVEFERGHYEFTIRGEDGEKIEVYIDSRSGEIKKVKKNGD